MLFGHPVRAVRLPDGRVAAAFNDLVEALGLVRNSQARRVHEDDTIGDQLLPALLYDDSGVEIPGDVLTAWAIPLWLTGIQPSRLAPEKRPKVRAFRREAADVLYQHFSQRQLSQDAPDLLALVAPTAVVATPMTAPAPTEPPSLAPDASADERRVWRQLMRDWLDRLDDMDAWRAATEARVETVEGRVDEIASIIPTIIHRLGEQPLTAEHLATIQQGVNIIHDGLGLPHAHVYNELHQSFRVGRYDQIPEARWPDVVVWFRPRTEAARKASRAKGHTTHHDPFADDTPDQQSLF